MRLASFTISGALALAVATVAMGQAFAPPTWPQLFVGLDGRPPGAVPGLARPIGPDSSRTATAVPTARQCAAQWNMHAPSATKRWLGSHGATRADVTVMKVGAQKVGTSERYVFSQCAFGLRVGPKTLVAAVAPLPNSSAAWRGELLGYRTSAALAHLARRFNASVTSDGRLRLF